MSKFRLMVVDDDPDVRYVVCALLGLEFETTQALNGLDALEKVDRHEPDLVILDINMPVMNGLSCCSAIRRNLSVDNLPVIFVSGAASEAMRNSARAVGGGAFFEKPFDTAELIGTVNKLLTEHGASPSRKRFTLTDLERMDNEPLEEHTFESSGPYPSVNSPVTESSIETVNTELPRQRKRRVFGKAREEAEQKSTPPPPPPAPPAPPPPVAKPREEPTPPSRPPAEPVRPKAPPPKREKEAPAQPSAAEILAQRRLAAIGKKQGGGGTKPRVLVLIDSPADLEASNTALKGLAEFLPLEDPVEAIELIARFQPDIVVTAIQSASHSGLQIASLLRSNPRLAQTELLFLRPLGMDPKLLEGAAGYTSNPVLRSPINPEDFRAAVERIIRKPGFKVRVKNLPYGVYVREVIRAADEERVLENKLKERESVEVKMNSLARFMARELAGTNPPHNVNIPTGDDRVREHRVD